MLPLVGRARGRDRIGVALASSALCVAAGASHSLVLLEDGDAMGCVEINRCVGCTRQFFTKSFLGDDVAVLAW